VWLNTASEYWSAYQVLLMRVTLLYIKVLRTSMSKLKVCFALIQQSSVFSRLGEKSQVSSTSNQDMLQDKDYTEDTPVPRESVLPYAGVFKQESRKKIVKKIPVQKSKKHSLLKKVSCYIQHSGELESSFCRMEIKLQYKVSCTRSFIFIRMASLL